jgi:hypothetical protein
MEAFFTDIMPRISLIFSLVKEAPWLLSMDC